MNCFSRGDQGSLRKKEVLVMMLIKEKDQGAVLRSNKRLMLMTNPLLLCNINQESHG